MRPENRRVLLKVSGEALAAEGASALDARTLRRLAEEVGTAAQENVDIAIVVGGGNFMRGRALRESDVAAHTADYMGMLATIMNGFALTDTLRACGFPAAMLSALEVPGVVHRYEIAAAERFLAEGTVLVLAGGTGNPYFTTDTCASLRAVELGADVLLKGTKVSGIYCSDPVKNPHAEFYTKISYADVLEQKLEVMDATAIALCLQHQMPIRVFDMSKPGNIKRAILGDNSLGTLIEPDGRQQA